LSQEIKTKWWESLNCCRWKNHQLNCDYHSYFYFIFLLQISSLVFWKLKLWLFHLKRIVIIHLKISSPVLSYLDNISWLCFINLVHPNFPNLIINVNGKNGIKIIERNNLKWELNPSKSKAVKFCDAYMLNGFFGFKKKIMHLNSFCWGEVKIKKKG
jgi:hypothetical protein